MRTQYETAVKGLAGKFPEIQNTISEGVTAKVTAYMQSEDGQNAVAALTQEYNKKGMSPEEAQKKAIEDVKAQAIKTITPQVRAAVSDGLGNDSDFTAAKNGIITAMTAISTKLNEVNESVNGSDSKIKNKLLPGLQAFNAAATPEAIDDLTGGQKEIAGGIATIASGVLGNSTLKEGVRKAMGNEALVLLRTYSGSSSPAYVDDFASFENQMDKTPGIVTMLLKARAFLGQTIADGTDTYNAGLKKLNAGKAEYAQGLADYAAAPGKLADGEKQLADGEKELADGYKQYEDGKKQLADGKKKLAEYEDGEQQVRDGLATLMATEADPGLESILDRRNGDDKFDDANGHLQLDEGLEAVDTGRGYQAESGELITKEVTNRAVGTAAGLGAAALAVLAAILSFLKKNKGAAVSAVLAAVAGGIGAGVGLSAGEYYSDIAGSTIGNTPFIAAAILAVVAAVFAIVHFTAKPEAK